MHFIADKGSLTRVLSPKSPEVNPCNLSHLERRSLDLMLHKGPQYDIDAYMTTLCNGETWNLYSEVGRVKGQIRLSHKSRTSIK